VELVILTADEIFMQTLHEAAGGTRKLWHVATAGELGDQLLAGRVGIFVLDVQAYGGVPGDLVARIKQQFPDLVVMAAGDRDAEYSLARFISTGAVYRYIHKPVSPGRAKLFVDAAARKYGEQRKRPRAAPRSAGNRRGILFGVALGTIGAASIGALIAVLMLRTAREAEPPARPASISPAEPEVATPTPPGPFDARDRLLMQAEHALLSGRADDAARAIEAARKAGVEGGRITFLRSQLSALRERAKAAIGGPRPKAGVPIPESAPGDPQLERALSLAAERIEEGRLIDPAHDGALDHVRVALELDPNGNATQAARETLARELLAETRGAIERGDLARAEVLLDASDGIASSSNVANMRQMLRAARAQGEIDARDKLLAAAHERLQQDRLIDPANDSAAYYLAALRNLDPNHPGLSQASQELGTRLVAKGRGAIELKHYDAARDWLTAAAAIGFTSPESIAALRDLKTATEQQEFLANVVDAARLTLVKSVEPAYPLKAEQARTEGWVELEFTVAESGEVEDISVHAANPPGTFEKAAIAALSQWRYRPVLRDDKPSAQRARIRIRFTLAG
jgi:TonB family protein